MINLPLAEFLVNLLSQVFDVGDAEENLNLNHPLSISVFPPGHTAGARIFSNSWGISISFYLDDAASSDKFMYENPDSLILFAAGNDGENGLFSVGNPAVSKNVLAVGATQNPHTNSQDKDRLAFFSSLGPTDDGRIKPDVCAPGDPTYSSDSTSGCGVIALAGKK